jgi:hypothetical protein
MAKYSIEAATKSIRRFMLFDFIEEVRRERLSVEELLVIF